MSNPKCPEFGYSLQNVNTIDGCMDIIVIIEIGVHVAQNGLKLSM